MILSRSDLSSPVWLKLKAYYTERLALLRAQNDDKPMDQTERHRGKIAEVKLFLGLEEEARKAKD